MTDEEKIETPGAPAWITTQTVPGTIESIETSAKIEVPRPRKSRRTQAQMAEAEARGEKPRRGTSRPPPVLIDVVDGGGQPILPLSHGEVAAWPPEIRYALGHGAQSRMPIIAIVIALLSLSMSIVALAK